MKARYLIRKSGRTIRHNRTRTLLTSLAVAVSAFVLTLALAAGEGTRQYSERLIRTNINPRAMFIAKDKFAAQSGNNQGSAMIDYNPETTTNQQGEIVKQLDQDDISFLQQYPHLENVRPRPSLEIEYLALEGSDKRFVAPVAMYDATIRYTLVKGSLPPLGTDIANDEIIVPLRYAELMVKRGVIRDAESLVGKRITLTVTRPVNQLTEEEIRQGLRRGGPEAVQELAEPAKKEVTLTVRALSERLSSLSNSLTGVIQVPPGPLNELYDFKTYGSPHYKKYVYASALVSRGENLSEVEEALEDIGYPSITADDLQARLFGIVGIGELIALGFGTLTLIAAVFGIVNTQYISVLERTRQIGAMRALGMRSRDIARLFRYEAAWIGAVGGLIGVGVAYMVTLVANPLIAHYLPIGRGERLLIFQPLDSLVVVMVLTVIAIIAGYLPARRAARLDPIKTLRLD
jgi:putative ABC transport system permease protein